MAVSRAFGDFQFKTSTDLPPEKQRVTCLPDIKIVARTLEDELLILACDGLWDVMSNEDACAEIRKLFSAGERDMVLIAEEMLDLSLFKGTRDNVSAVILRLSGARIGSVVGETVNSRRRQRAYEEMKRREEKARLEQEHNNDAVKRSNELMAETKTADNISEK